MLVRLYIRRIGCIRMRRLLVLVLGLGYLGNGSGAVMPIEAMVFFYLFSFFSLNLFLFYRACQEKEASN